MTRRFKGTRSETAIKRSEKIQHLAFVFDAFMNESGLSYAYIGGAAIRYYIPSRCLDDLDVLVSESTMELLRDHPLLTKYGFTSTRKYAPVLHHVRYGRVDILCPERGVRGRLAQKALRATKKSFLGMRVRIPSISVLIGLKRQAMEDPSREDKDRQDIHALNQVGRYLGKH